MLDNEYKVRPVHLMVCRCLAFVLLMSLFMGHDKMWSRQICGADCDWSVLIMWQICILSLSSSMSKTTHKPNPNPGVITDPQMCKLSPFRSARSAFCHVPLFTWRCDDNIPECCDDDTPVQWRCLTCIAVAQVDVVDVDLNLVIEADLHLLSVLVVQLGAAPAQFVSVSCCCFCFACWI